MYIKLEVSMLMLILKPISDIFNVKYIWVVFITKVQTFSQICSSLFYLEIQDKPNQCKIRIQFRSSKLYFYNPHNYNSVIQSCMK